MSTDVRGRIAIDVQFWDRTSSEGVQSLKTISLQDSTEYTSGKVAVVTGTVGTSEVSVAVAPGTYRDASGAIVSFASVSRFAFSATPGAYAAQEGVGSGAYLYSLSGQSAISNQNAAGVVDTSADFLIGATAGTATYTLVIYGT